MLSEINFLCINTFLGKKKKLQAGVSLVYDDSIDIQSDIFH